MVTGDEETVAQHVSKEVGIEDYHANISPEKKAQLVQKYQKQGFRTGMTGDGINDAVALKTADISFAIGSGTDLAIENAQMIIVNGGAEKIVEIVKLARKTFRIIRQNLFWAFFYNLIAIPLAMLGILHPVIAEIAMFLSSITVIINSMRLKQGQMLSKS